MTGLYFNKSKFRYEVWWGGLMLGWISKEAVDRSPDKTLSMFYEKIELHSYFLLSPERTVLFSLNYMKEY